MERCGDRSGDGSDLAGVDPGRCCCGGAFISGYEVRAVVGIGCRPCCCCYVG